MTARSLSVVEVRKDLADVMAQVAYAGMRFVVERKGRPMMALVSPDDLRRLEALEDAADSELLRRAKAASRGAVPLDQLIAEADGSPELAAAEAT